MKQNKHRSKFLLWLPVFVLGIVFIMPKTVCGADFYTEGNFQYTISGKAVTIHSYFGSEKDVVLPSQIAGLDVTGVDDFAFAGCTTVNSITIPDTVTSVGDSSFTGAKNLQKIYNQSKTITPKVGEQVLLIADYPMYAPKQTEDNVDSDKPAGEKDSTVSIPNSNQVLSVDDSKNLILIDTDGNITVLDPKKNYAIAHKGDGAITIVDENGNEIQIENGIIKNSNGDAIATVEDRTEKTYAKEKGFEKSQILYIVLAVVAALTIVGCIFYFRRRKQINVESRKGK